jgi:hypothetical protein
MAVYITVVLVLVKGWMDEDIGHAILMAGGWSMMMMMMVYYTGHYKMSTNHYKNGTIR